MQRKLLKPLWFRVHQHRSHNFIPLVLQPVHTEGLAADRPVMPPPQGLPGDRVGRVGPLLQNLCGPRVSSRKSYSHQTGAPIPCGRGGRVPSPSRVRPMWTPRQRRAALRYVSFSQWRGGRDGEGSAGTEQKLFIYEWNCICGIHTNQHDLWWYMVTALLQLLHFSAWVRLLTLPVDYLCGQGNLFSWVAHG